MNIMVDN